VQLTDAEGQLKTAREEVAALHSRLGELLERRERPAEAPLAAFEELAQLTRRLQDVEEERAQLQRTIENSLALRIARSLPWILNPVRRAIAGEATSLGEIDGNLAVENADAAALAGLRVDIKSLHEKVSNLGREVSKTESRGIRSFESSDEKIASGKRDEELGEALARVTVECDAMRSRIELERHRHQVQMTDTERQLAVVGEQVAVLHQRLRDQIDGIERSTPHLPKMQAESEFAPNLSEAGVALRTVRVFTSLLRSFRTAMAGEKAGSRK
jgi:hypothetical protein